MTKVMAAWSIPETWSDPTVYGQTKVLQNISIGDRRGSHVGVRNPRSISIQCGSYIATVDLGSVLTDRFRLFDALPSLPTPLLHEDALRPRPPCLGPDNMPTLSIHDRIPSAFLIHSLPGLNRSRAIPLVGALSGPLSQASESCYPISISEPLSFSRDRHDSPMVIE